MRRDRSSVLDDEALSAAYTEHAGGLYRLALESLRDGSLAEEVVQETFLKAWRAADRFDPKIASLPTWLFAIARNVIVDTIRARCSRPFSPVGVDEQAAVEHDDSFDRVLEAWQVEEALRRLSDQHRVVLVETVIKDRPYAEVGRELAIPEGTVKSRVYYALKVLRLSLEEMGWDT